MRNCTLEDYSWFYAKPNMVEIPEEEGSQVLWFYLARRT